MRAMPNAALLTDRAVIRLTGEDRRSFLQGLITQDMDRLAPGRPIFAALLTPQGKILFDFFIVDDGEAFLIDCNRGSLEALIKKLKLYKLRAKVDIDRQDDLHVAVSEHEFADPEGLTFPDRRMGALGWRTITAEAGKPDNDAYEARRIGLGVPEAGKDFGSDEMFLLDVNYDALDGVSYKKGCFVGQEVTSRMKRKGEPRRRTLIADFEGAAPAKGAAIAAGASTVGEIMSGVPGKALALIRMDRWARAQEAGEQVLCGDRALRLRLPDYLKQD